MLINLQRNLWWYIYGLQAIPITVLFLSLCVSLSSFSLFSLSFPELYLAFQ